MEQQLTKQIDDRKKNIEVTLNEMRQQNEDVRRFLAWMKMLLIY